MFHGMLLQNNIMSIKIDILHKTIDLFLGWQGGITQIADIAIFYSIHCYLFCGIITDDGSIFPLWMDILILCIRSRFASVHFELSSDDLYPIPPSLIQYTCCIHWKSTNIHTLGITFWPLRKVDTFLEQRRNLSGPKFSFKVCFFLQIKASLSVTQRPGECHTWGHFFAPCS